MFGTVFFSAGHTDALDHAVTILKGKGCDFSASPCPEVTHLLLDVPSFNADGSLKGGGQIDDVLKDLPRSVQIFGGGLDHPVLDGYRCVDLLQDPLYLAENANITAHCAVRLATEKLPVVLAGCHILVIGWGRIGKCLAKLLRAMGAIVTVAARKEADRAMLLALGYDAIDTTDLCNSIARYRVIYNTVPESVLSADAFSAQQYNSLKIDLASVKGMEAGDVLWARGLPNKYAPEASGELIARSVLRLR